MIGTWVNVVGIVMGSLIGLLLNKGIPERINTSILKVEGVVIGIIGLNGVLSAMLKADTVTGKISDSGGLLLLVSLVLGCLVGELLRLDDRLNQFGRFVESRLKASNFATGFVTGTLVFCIGAMSVIGPLNDGLTGDTSILYIKTTLDFTTAIVLTSALGAGVLFSAVPVLVLQGTVALLARQIKPFISEGLLAVFCMVGFAIVLCIGVNFLCDAKIKTANLLPALVVPVVYYFVFAV